MLDVWRPFTFSFFRGVKNCFRNLCRAFCKREDCEVVQKGLVGGGRIKEGLHVRSWNIITLGDSEPPTVLWKRPFERRCTTNGTRDAPLKCFEKLCTVAVQLQAEPRRQPAIASAASDRPWTSAADPRSMPTPTVTVRCTKSVVKPVVFDITFDSVLLCQVHGMKLVRHLCHLAELRRNFFGGKAVTTEFLGRSSLTLGIHKHWHWMQQARQYQRSSPGELPRRTKRSRSTWRLALPGRL